MDDIKENCFKNKDLSGVSGVTEKINIIVLVEFQHESGFYLGFSQKLIYQLAHFR